MALSWTSLFEFSPATYLNCILLQCVKTIKRFNTQVVFPYTSILTNTHTRTPTRTHTHTHITLHNCNRRRPILAVVVAGVQRFCDFLDKQVTNRSLHSVLNKWNSTQHRGNVSYMPLSYGIHTSAHNTYKCIQYVQVHSISVVCIGYIVAYTNWMH